MAIQPVHAECSSSKIIPSTTLQSRRSGGDTGALPLITVIIPVFNEAHYVESILDRVEQAYYPKQVIVVDDGSWDGTAQHVEQLATRFSIVPLFHRTNLGKGAAIRTALDRAVGEYVVIQDADLEYNPEDYRRLVTPIIAGEADAVYGSRYLAGYRTYEGRERFDIGVKFLNVAVRCIYGQVLTDEATCYKVFSLHVLRRMDLRCMRFEFCPEVTAKAFRMGLRIKEVPIGYRPRTIADGKKIRLSDGFHALRTLWKYRNWKPTS